MYDGRYYFLVEPILSLASELQAIGRIHRIGQTKPTFVHRLYVRRHFSTSILSVAILLLQKISILRNTYNAYLANLGKGYYRGAAIRGIEGA